MRRTRVRGAARLMEQVLGLLEGLGVDEAYFRWAKRRGYAVRGPNGNTFVGYYSPKAAEAIAFSREKADWEQADRCSTCGKKIVHVFFVQDAKTGEVLPYGSEHVHVALGYPRPITRGKAQELKAMLPAYLLERGNYLAMLAQGYKTPEAASEVFQWESKGRYDGRDLRLLKWRESYLVVYKGTEEAIRELLYDEPVQYLGVSPMRMEPVLTPKQQAEERIKQGLIAALEGAQDTPEEAIRVFRGKYKENWAWVVDRVRPELLKYEGRYLVGTGGAAERFGRYLPDYRVKLVGPVE